MIDTIKQYALVALAGIVLYNPALWVVDHLRSMDGLTGMPLVFCAAPVHALLVALGAIVMCGVVSLIVGRLTHRTVGIFTFGLGLLLVARLGASIDDVTRFMEMSGITPSAGYWSLAGEAAAWSIMICGVIYLHIFIDPNADTDQSGRFDPVSLCAAAVSLVLTTGLLWVFLRTDLKGQTVFGSLMASVLAVAMVRLVWPRANATILFTIPLIATVVLLAWSALTISSAAATGVRDLSGNIPVFARLLPLDGIGSGLAGVALGLGFAHIFGVESSPWDESQGIRNTEMTC